MKLFVLLVCLALFIDAGNSLYVDVDANEEACYYDRVEHIPSKILFTFQVVYGGFLDIHASVRNPASDLLWKGEKLSDAAQTLNADVVGKYSFCFNNTMSTITLKTVKFDISVVSGETAGNATRLESMMEELRQVGIISIQSN